MKCVVACMVFVTARAHVNKIWQHVLYGRFPKFHRVCLGRDPGTLKSDIVSKKTSTINLFGFETLKLKIRRLKLWKPTAWGVSRARTVVFSRAVGCGFVVSANLRNTCWPFYMGKSQSPQISAILRKTFTKPAHNNIDIMPGSVSVVLCRATPCYAAGYAGLLCFDMQCPSYGFRSRSDRLLGLGHVRHLHAMLSLIVLSVREIRLWMSEGLTQTHS